MKIKFTKIHEQEIVTGYDEATDLAETENEVFPKDEVHEVELLSEGPEHIDVQFGDGSVAYALPKNVIEVIEE